MPRNLNSSSGLVENSETKQRFPTAFDSHNLKLIFYLYFASSRKFLPSGLWRGFDLHATSRTRTSRSSSWEKWNYLPLGVFRGSDNKSKERQTFIDRGKSAISSLFYYFFLHLSKFPCWFECKQFLDRETRREKVIEAKNREIRLKMKTSLRPEVDPESQNGNSRGGAQKSRVLNSQDPLIVQCELDYETAIDAVKR